LFPLLGWINMGNHLTRELVFLSLPTTSFLSD
jgi:hypothetical protein